MFWLNTSYIIKKLLPLYTVMTSGTAFINCNLPWHKHMFLQLKKEHVLWTFPYIVSSFRVVYFSLSVRRGAAHVVRVPSGRLPADPRVMQLTIQILWPPWRRKNGYEFVRVHRCIK